MQISQNGNCNNTNASSYTSENDIIMADNYYTGSNLKVMEPLLSTSCSYNFSYQLIYVVMAVLGWLITIITRAAVALIYDGTDSYIDIFSSRSSTSSYNVRIHLSLCQSLEHLITKVFFNGVV